ncbi:MAG: NADH-quinone oxidoreductase subunit C [Bacteroidetes bacterium]|nr:NADH-quinone oxidoreductase subunit C [Bacteroidota bacterium]
MENSLIIGKLTKRFRNDILFVDDSSDMLTVTVSHEVIHEVIRFLMDDETLNFNFLTTLCGIHYPENPLPLGVVYHMHNFFQNRRIRIKTFLPLENPSVKSITDLFQTANWMEREAYDFYGILFEGHPNLKRILNMENMDYFPMRKEYPLEDATRKDKDDRFFGR